MKGLAAALALALGAAPAVSRAHGDDLHDAVEHDHARPGAPAATAPDREDHDHDGAPGSLRTAAGAAAIALAFAALALWHRRGRRS